MTDPATLLAEAIELAAGLAELQGAEPETRERASNNATTRVAIDWILANRGAYHTALADEVRGQPNAPMLLSALDRAAWSCQRCSSSALRMPEPYEGRCLVLCRVCRERWRALTPRQRVVAVLALGARTPR